MRFRGLLIALVVLAALGGGVYWSNRVKKAQEGKPSPDAAPVILTIPEDQFRRIEIEKAGSAPLVLQKADSGKWEMTSPPKWPVDQDAASGIVEGWCVHLSGNAGLRVQHTGHAVKFSA